MEEESLIAAMCYTSVVAKLTDHEENDIQRGLFEIQSAQQY